MQTTDRNNIASAINGLGDRFDGFVLHLAQACRMSSRRFKSLLILLLIFALTLLSASQITDADIQKDALVNLRFASNLARHGALSISESDPYLASNAREPIPNIVAGLHLRILDLFQPNLSFNDLAQGRGSQLLKLVNLYWVVLGLVATSLLASALLNSFLLEILAIMLVGYFFFAVPMIVDTLYTELQAAVLLLWTSWFLLRASSRLRSKDAMLVGIGFGLLSLTKAITFYVCLLVMTLLLLRWLWVSLRSGFRFRSGRASALAMLAGFALAVLPWTLRNRVELGTFQLTQRGGRVMYARAIKNRMENGEIPGAIYFWGPSFYQHISRRLGFGAEPHDFQAGGRYRRINRYGSNFQRSDYEAMVAGRPQDVVSYHRKVGAEVNRIAYQAAAQGVPDPNRYAEKQVGAKARRMIVGDPIRHLVMTPLFAWRGIWSWPNEGAMFKTSGLYVLVKDLLSLASYVSLFIVFLIGVLRRRARDLAITVFPVGMLLAYALLTHNIPRYSSPAIPLMILSMVVLLERVASPGRPTGHVDLDGQGLA
jgi:hypothetical protein